MADVVTRLVVESKEYDSKIARATSGLTQFEKKCREVGGTLAYVEKEDLAFVQALGQMDTVATTATGKLGELKKAFTELSVQYQNLTKEEKQSPYGKALAGSLDQLKGRIKDLQGNLSKAQSDMTGFGDAFKQMGAKMGIPMNLFTKFGPYMAAAASAIKVASDAFKQNEELLDDWKAGIEAAQATYQGFLYALNTGDIRGFLSRLSEISEAAREAYKALDQLETFNAFNQINLQKAQTQFTEIVASYREGGASRSDVRAAADAWKNELEKRQNMEMEAYLSKIKEIAASRGVDAELLTKALSGSYGDYESLKALPMPTKSVYNSSTRSFYEEIDWEGATEAQKLGYALRKLNDTELQSVQGLGRQAETTANEIAQIDKQVARLLRGGQNSKTQSTNTSKTDFKLGDWRNAPEAGSLADLERQATAVRNSMGGAINAEEYKEMEDHLNTILEKIKEIKGEVSTTFEKGSLNDLQQQLREAQAVLANMSPESEAWSAALQDVIDKQAAVNALQEKMNGNLKKTSEAMTEVKDTWESINEGVDTFSSMTGAMDGLKSSVEDLTEAFSGEKDAWDSMMTVINSGISIMQNVMGIMEAMNTLTELSTSLKQANTIATETEAATSVASAATETGAEAAKAAANMTTAGTAAAASSAEAGSAVAGIPIVGPILAVAAIAAVLAATMVAISKAKSAGSFATGGIVPGNNYNDGLVANVSSGELILNRAQQDSIAGQLNSAQPSIVIVGRISGRDILLAADNSNASRGGRRGTYANVKG